MFNIEEIEKWEQEQIQKVLNKYCSSKSKFLFDPEKERLFKARKKRSLKHGSYNESWDNKRIWKRHIRSKYRLINNESTHPPKKEYHTYGWMTW
ncbi:hypothetical protein ABFV99_13445 [Cytobacillus horneckiae]|uniref:hypothetical protein n=1 Tax=Cytobacillus horneckiae TaxID=549687 RepID=UPI0034CF9790